MNIPQLDTLHIIWLAHLAAYRSREAFEQRLERYRRKGI